MEVKGSFAPVNREPDLPGGVRFRVNRPVRTNLGGAENPSRLAPVRAGLSKARGSGIAERAFSLRSRSPDGYTPDPLIDFSAALV